MSKKNYIILAVAVIIGAAIQLFVPAVGGLTPAGVSMLAVFIPTIILWIGIGTGWTSFLALTVLALMQVLDGQTVFNTAWGNSVNVVIIPMLIIVQVMIDSGADAAHCRVDNLQKDRAGQTLCVLCPAVSGDIRYRHRSCTPLSCALFS